MCWAGHAKPRASPKPLGTPTGTQLGPDLLPPPGEASHHLPWAPTPPCLTPASIPLSALPLPSWGMEDKPREPKATANSLVGLPTAKCSPQPSLGTSLLCGVPHIPHGAAQGQGAAAPVPARGQEDPCPPLPMAEPHSPAPCSGTQPQSCSLAPTVCPGDTPLRWGVPPGKVHILAIGGISRAQGDLPQDREPAPAPAWVWLARRLGCWLCTHPCGVGAPHGSWEPL